MGDEEEIERLLKELQRDDPEARDRATRDLWQRWFMQKGMYGFSQLQKAQSYWEAGDRPRAEELLSATIAAQPDFAEAWNRRAVLYYLSGEYDRALADCEQVLALVPYHFGALHGAGLCYAATQRYREAITTFRRALAVQPYALDLQRSILECTARLS